MNNSRQELKNAKRIVIKIGTSSLLHENGLLNLRTIDQLAFVLSTLMNEGKEIVLVSSGAIGAGLQKLNLTKRPTSIPEQQAIAAIGQIVLMNTYSSRFSSYGQDIAQVLLTRDVVEYPTSRLNVVNAMEELLQRGIIPIINENDTVSVDELEHETKFGDNDKLSAIVSILVEADLLIMLSDIDGFYSANPKLDDSAVLISEVNEITQSIENLAGEAGSRFGTGGMHSKLECAKQLFEHNQAMVLTRGKHPKTIFDILKGQAVGTLFIQAEGGNENE